MQKLQHLVRVHEVLQNGTGSSPTWPAKWCLLEHGVHGLRDRYFQANGIAGRLDLTFPFRDVTGLMQFVALATGSGKGWTQIRRWLDRLFDCKRYTILCDVSLSGNTVAGDIRDLNDLLGLLGVRRVDFEVVLLCGTSTARRVLEEVHATVHVIDEIPEHFRSRNRDSVITQIGHKWKDVEHLCVWFRDQMIPSDSNIRRLARTLQDQDILLWGFGGEGWMVSGNPNTPNNALPLLWVDSEEKGYKAPYPRIPSRLYEHSMWNLRGPYMDIIRKHFGRGYQAQ